MLRISIYMTFATNHFKSESVSSFSFEQNGKRKAPLLHQCSVALFPARLWLPVDAGPRVVQLGGYCLLCEEQKKTSQGYKNKISPKNSQTM